MAFGDRETNTRFMKIESEADLAVIGEEVSGTVSFSNNRYVSDPNGAFRFAVNVFDGKKIRALEGGAGLYKAIGKVLKANGEDSMVRVAKTGSGMETRWSASFLRKLTDEDHEIIGQCEKVDLLASFAWASPAQGGEEPGF